MGIPKKIHYCWLSDDEMPIDTVKCIESWKNKMPEYELILWDKNKFDMRSIPFVEEACRIKKWATASDYIRLYAIYTEGGVYLDTDVYVKKHFDDFMGNDFFTSVEYHKGLTEKDNAYEQLNDDGTLKNPGKDRIFTGGIGIQAAIFGGIKEHPYLKSCCEWYKNNPHILSDGIYNKRIIAPAVYADVAIEYGFRYKDELQKLKDDMIIYPSKIFASSRDSNVKESYAVHCCVRSWRDKSKETLLTHIKQVLKKNNILRTLLGKNKYDNRTIDKKIEDEQ